MSDTVQPDTPEPAQPPETTASDIPADDTSPTPDESAAASGGVEAEAAEEREVEAEVIELDPAAAREAELQKQLDELQARLRAVSSAYREQQDEISETKARLERQAALKEEMRRGEVLAALFDPVENLKRSLDAARKGASPEDTATGLEMVHKAFMGAFEKLGLEEVPGAGARFDPNLHEALTLVPVTDPALDGVVLEVFSAGYRIGGRLIKAARVVVGQHQEPAGEA